MTKNRGFGKFLFLLLAAICFCELIHGQDLIIGYNGDTIKCKVTKIDTSKIYFIMKTKNGPAECSIDRNIVKNLIVPVLPNNPTRMMYENNIEKFSTTGIISGVGAVLGLVLSINGINEILNSFQSAVNGDSDAFNKGFIEAGIGLPLAITGTIIGFISLHKVIYNKIQLKKLYNLSLNMNYNTRYKGITISYRF